MKWVNTVQRYKIFHLLFWLLLFALWYFFRYQDYALQTTAVEITALKVADLALMVYLTNYLLIPQLLYKKHYGWFALAFIALVFFSSWLKMYLEGKLMHNPALFNLADRFKSRFYDNVIPHFLLVSTGAGFKLLMDYAKAQRRIGEMAKETAEAELNFLKSQINPHFVFNSLNSVYFLIDKQNQQARDALHKFSGMLRYQLYECNGHEVSMEKEMAYLEDYINMQRLRTEHCLVHFHHDQELNAFTIAPLLLIPFVENAFKHLSHFTDGRVNEITITATAKERAVDFYVRNTTETTRNKAVNEHHGIGLKNVQRRLELLYPGRHELSIKQDADAFEVRLTLKGKK